MQITTTIPQNIHSTTIPQQHTSIKIIPPDQILNGLLSTNINDCDCTNRNRNNNQNQNNNNKTANNRNSNSNNRNSV